MHFCRGACDNNDAEFIGDIMFNGQQLQGAQSSCTCCTGEGYYEDVMFLCFNTPTVFQVKQMESCGCTTCGGDEVTDEIEDEDEDSGGGGGFPDVPDNTGLFGQQTNTDQQTETPDNTDMGGLFGQQTNIDNTPDTGGLFNFG